jgi:uncharacterized protein YdaL
MITTFSFSAFSSEALILYDGSLAASEAFKSGRFIQQLLEHFDLDRINLIRAVDYRSGEMAAADVVFAVFEEDRPEMTDSFLKDLTSFPGAIVWLNMHVDRFLGAAAGRYGMIHEGFSQSGKWKILFQGTEFVKDDPWINTIRVPKKQPASVLAEAVDESERRFPYAIHAGNLWYFVDSPFAFALESGRFLILAELLHDILGRPHTPSRRALVRIEDINPESDPASLKQIADYLARESVPFQVSLIPILKDPDQQREVLLSERPAVVEALAYMMSKGGTIILHGATHQHRGRSGSDYEFWDDIAGVPIQQGDAEWADRRVRLGLAECFRCQIHPLAWETPHYSASASDYRTFAKYFDTFYDRVMSAELAGTQQPFPYPVQLREYGVTVVPENLGYVEINNPDPSLILRGAERMKVVRDGMASFFFHPFVPIAHLKTIVRGLKKEGWVFHSIRDFPCNLRTESCWVTSEGGEGKIVLANQYAHVLQRNRKGKVITENFAPTRRLGIETRRITLKGGSLFVFEGLDVLPEPRRKTIWQNLARLNPFRSKKTRWDKVLEISRALILFRSGLSPEDEFDRKSFFSTLNIFGLNPEIREVREIIRMPLSGYNLIVVPQATAKTMQQPEINTLWDYVSGGGNLVLDGPSALAESLHLHFETKSIEVGTMKELTLPAQNLTWNPTAILKPLKAEGIEPLAKDAIRGAILAGIKKLKKGFVLGLATQFDPYTPYGISRFPYMPFYLKDGLKLPFNVRRNTLEFYFDPGLRQNVSWEKLVKRWKLSGIKIVYLAAWHFYASYQFNYSYFIKLCHDQGIAVYAWFEFPQVTPLFWDAHPEWREKTATGKDARCHWRLQMNLAHPEAQKAAIVFFRDMLSAHDWDGVNLAELNFDTNKGLADPDKFTPMNADIRKDFREKEGFDPGDLFLAASPRYWKKNRAAADAFLRYRSGIIRDWHRIFLDEIERVKRIKGADMEVIVTAMDSLLHPEIIEECGIDTRDIIGLMNQYSFTLQVEDPSRSWTGSPARYLEYLLAYKTLIADESRLMFDVNCLADRDIRGTNLPSATATGTELATTVFYASIPSGRVGIYAESTIHPFDFDLLAYVLGADVAITTSGRGYEITAKRPFTLNLTRTDIIPFIDRKAWPFVGTKGISAPSGIYRLDFEKAGVLDFPSLAYQMVFDGDFTSLEGAGNAYKLSYRSPLPVSLTFNLTPDQMRLDGIPITPTPEQTGVMLPRGEHVLEIVTERMATRAVRVAGYMTSSIFYILGLVSMLLLLGVYVYSRFMRWRNL